MRGVIFRNDLSISPRARSRTAARYATINHYSDQVGLRRPQCPHRSVPTGGADVGSYKGRRQRPAASAPLASCRRHESRAGGEGEGGEGEGGEGEGGEGGGFPALVQGGGAKQVTLEVPLEVTLEPILGAQKNSKVWALKLVAELVWKLVPEFVEELVWKFVKTNSFIVFF